VYHLYAYKNYCQRHDMPVPQTVAPPATEIDTQQLMQPMTGRKRYNGYLVAMLLIGGAFALRYWLYGGLTNRLPFAFFLPATMIAAWYGGLGPGMLAAAAGLLLGDYFFLPPHQSLGPLGEVERTSVGIYAVTSTLAVFLIGNLQNRVRNLESEAAKGTAVDAAVSPPAPASGGDTAK
jgi:K+-sensing histidine kinase KdpD